MSRHHCQITTTAEGSILEDLNSTNGVYVKSKRVRRHHLNDGDVVVLGKHEIMYLDERSARARGRRRSRPAITRRSRNPTWAVRIAARTARMTDDAMRVGGSARPDRAQELLFRFEIRAVMALLDPVVASPQREHQTADDRDKPEERENPRPVRDAPGEGRADGRDTDRDVEVLEAPRRSGA